MSSSSELRGCGAACDFVVSGFDETGCEQLSF